MNWFRNLRLGPKLMCGFMLLLVIFTTMMVIAEIKLSLVANETGKVARESVPSLMTAYEMELSVVGVSERFTDVGATHDSAVFTEAEASAKKFYQTIDYFQKMYTNEKYAEGLKKVADLKAAFEKYYENGKLMALAYIEQGQEAGNERMTAFDAEREKMATLVETFQKQQADEAQKLSTDSAEHVMTLKKLMLSLTFLAIIFGVGIALLMTEIISRPINRMRMMLMDIAQGEGDLTRKLDDSSTDQIGETSRWFNTFTDKLKTIIVDISHSSAQVASASHQLRSTAEQIASGSEEVAAQSQGMATASEEMAATSQCIASNCLQAADSSMRAGELAKDGATVVQETIRGMEKIADSVREASSTVSKLGGRSDQIGAIVGTIEDIADQTNLLALNAAIEAARAGEQGRGFAVVADEVRALAERTTRATKEISSMIKTIQNETMSAVTTMENGVGEVERGTASSMKSGRALEMILDQIADVTTQINQIATAAEQQTATTLEIAQNINNMQDVVRQTASGASETADASSALSREAERLQSLVGQFKLE